MPVITYLQQHGIDSEDPTTYDRRVVHACTDEAVSAEAAHQSDEEQAPLPGLDTRAQVICSPTPSGLEPPSPDGPLQVRSSSTLIFPTKTQA